MRSLVLLATAALYAGPAAAAQALAIEDVTVIDVSTGVLRPHTTVVIEGEHITALGSTAVARVPAGARIVSGKDKFLIPGLWDMHVHLWYKQNQLPVFVAFGVTGVQDMGSDFVRVKAWRDDIEKGLAVGPRVVTSGPPVMGRASDDEKLPVLVARNANEARAAFDKLWEMGVDFVKVLTPLSRDAYFALAEQARHWEMRMVGHMPSGITAFEAIEARQRSIEHLSGIMQSVSTDADALRFFDRCAVVGTRISPTLVLWLRLSHADDPKLMSDPRLRSVPASIRNTWPDISADTYTWKPAVWRAYRLVALAKQTKVELLAGSDTGDPYTIPGATLHDELEQMVEAGLTAREALQTATLNPARFLGLDEAMGSIEKGKAADLVLLDRNPLEDIRDIRTIDGVCARGKYYSRKDLDAILGAVK